MVKIVFVDAAGSEHRVCAETGSSLMQAARDALVPGIEGACGGSCVCATCHAYIDPQWAARLPAPDEVEASMLACTAEPRPNSRLTCQVTVTEALDGMVVEIAASQH